MRTKWTWLGSGERATSVRVDEPPSGKCVGAVIIIPAVGRERVVAFRALRALAIRAAQCGFVTVSVDLAGEGDTPGLVKDGDLATAWRADIDSALSFARSRTNGPVHVVGLRLAAGLAADVPAAPGELRLLWEPIAGSAWLRQLRTLRRLAIAQPVVADGIELHDMHLRAAEAKSLTSITLPNVDAFAISETIVIRREVDRSVADRLATASPHQSSIPHKALDEIVWGLPRGALRPVITWSAVDQALTRPGVTETHRLVGGRHAVLTAPIEAPVLQAFAFTALGSELSSGPGNAWANGARTLAMLGAASLRMDRSALGDALDPLEVGEPLPYTERAVKDTEEQIRELCHSFPRAQVIGVGACAGAWCFLRAANAGGLSRVVAINQIHWAPNQSHYGSAFYVRAHGEEGRFHRGSGPPRAPEEEAKTGWAMRLLIRYGAFLHQMGGEHPRLAVLAHRTDYGDRVRRMLQRVPDGTTIDLLLGEREHGQFIGKGGGRYLRRGGRRFPVKLNVAPVLDHSLNSEGARREVLTHLKALVD